MKSGWKEASAWKRIVTIVSILASLSVIVLGVLQILNIWNLAVNISVPLMGLVMLCQAYIQWNASRKVAYFSLGTAGFIFICAIVVLFC